LLAVMSTIVDDSDSSGVTHAPSDQLHLTQHTPQEVPLPSATRNAAVSIDQIDLTTVIEVSQAISGEIVLERLIETLMQTALEHAGAERGMLILTQGSKQWIAAEATTVGQTTSVKLREDAVSSDRLPESVLAAVARTHENVILEDAMVLNHFSADPYFRRRRVRSLLCLPVASRAKLTGLLYLENERAPRVFTAARVTLLKFLASQAAMSIENTRLYRDLAEREARIRRFVDANIVGIVIADFEGRIIEANDAFLRMVGYDREDLAAGRLHWTELTPDKWHDCDRNDVIGELQRTGRLPPFEWEYIRKDGSRVPVLSGAATFEGGNQAVGFVLDLTERKRVEQALKQSERYLAEAQRMTHTGSWAYNHVRGEYTYYSDEQFRIHGLDPRHDRPRLEQILGLFHPEDRERMLNHVERIIREKVGYVVDYRILLPDGTVRYLHSTGHPILDEAGQLLEYFGTVMDVTERRRAEQRLLAQHRVTRILAEAATVEDSVPRILQALCECLACHLSIHWRIEPKEDLLRCAALWRVSVGAGARYEPAVRADGVPRGSGLAGRVWASRAAACIADVAHDSEFAHADVAARDGLHGAAALPVLLNGEVLGVIELISRDVWQPDQDLLAILTAIGSQIGQFVERKRAEAALQRAQSELAHATRIMTLGELTASIAHEVNQPLGAIVTSAGSCARWLAARPPDMEKARRALERIANDGRRAAEVIKRLRSLMKRQAPRKGSLSINEAILEVIALAQAELRRSHILVGTRLADLPRVQGDKVQLQQVLLNLIVNAIEAMSGVTERRRDLTITSSMEWPDAIRIEVRDSGTGLDAQHAARLFEPFYTTKAEGMGMGLSISRSIVEAHGGRLSAEANSPHGAVFRFLLPVSEPTGSARAVPGTDP
jgi:PAS domain S-box-containing protein